MTKNIIVVDDLGHHIGETYPKRAKGLVKNGRARFVDEHTICLARPPNKNLEESEMEMKDIKKAATAKDEPMPEKTAEKPLELTMEYVLSRIDQIMKDTAHIHEAMKAISGMPVNESPNGGYGDQAKGEAIANAVQSRETTNQQMLKLLEKMYDDLKPNPQVTLKNMEDLLNSNKILEAFVKAISESDNVVDTGDVIIRLYQLYEDSKEKIMNNMIAKMK